MASPVHLTVKRVGEPNRSVRERGRSGSRAHAAARYDLRLAPGEYRVCAGWILPRETSVHEAVGSGGGEEEGDGGVSVTDPTTLICCPIWASWLSILMVRPRNLKSAQGPSQRAHTWSITAA